MFVKSPPTMLSNKTLSQAQLVNILFFFATSSITAQIPVPVNVGVVLDLETLGGRIGLSCINMALSDLYASNPHYKTRLLVNPRDSKTDVIAAAAAALDLIKNVQVQAIIGPNTSTQANFVIDLGQKAQVPIISYSATSPSLNSIRSDYFIRATQEDSTQVKAISAIVKAFGWREAVPIYLDNEFGEGIIPYLIDALQEANTRVPYRSVIHPSATDNQITKELYKLMTMQTRVFIVHIVPSLGARLFTKAKEIGMMDAGYVWIMTDGMTNQLTSLDSTAIDSMQGVLGVKTFLPKTRELDNFTLRWKRKFQRDNPSVVDLQLDIFGLWAHDAALALGIAVEKAGTAELGFQKNNGSSSTTELETFGVSQNGPKLLQVLSSSGFKGLTGNYSLANGKLQSSTFQIVNINGNGWRQIGYWTPTSGLARNLSLASTSTYSASKANLGTIIWPGDSTSVPKGWENPTNAKKLKIGVPKKNGFTEFVKVTRDPINNTTTVTGYCIDIFKAVIEALPYAVPYEFISFENPDGHMAGSYNDMVDQVYYGAFDAVVGDTTIIANRSNYVDFTLPYTESGVSMIVPIKDRKKKNGWIFLKPLTRDLWVTSACFFVFIGWIVWVLEHRINPDFRGPPSHQVGTSFWFSFSTMVFAQRERVVSNLARFVVIIWCFVVLILTQSYTASLASLLTVQQLQPTVTNVTVLVNNGALVGYQKGSFVLGILQKLGFSESNLRVYNSLDEWTELFSEENANGTIAAAFDEVPFIKLFLAQHCSKYAMIDPTFKTDGFGFVCTLSHTLVLVNVLLQKALMFRADLQVFPRGSPLVADISRAILNVTEGDKMAQIENAWFGTKTSCPDSSTSISSNSLGVESFWGLFLIAGVAASLALIIFTAMFLYEHRHLVLHEGSIWRRIGILCSNFDKKDLNSHTFRKSDMPDRNGMHSVHCLSAPEASPASNFRTSPLNETDSRFAYLGGQGTPAAEFEDRIPDCEPSPDLMPGIVELTDSDHRERPATLEIVCDNN